MINYKVHENGRPTKQSQIYIQKTLRIFFERGISAYVTSLNTGINIKTIYKYFDEWSEQITEADTADFLERQKTDRARTIVAFDEQIVRAFESLDNILYDIDKLRKEGKSVPRHLLSLSLEAQKHITSLNEKKGAFLMQPVIDDALREKLVEMMKSGKLR